MLDKVSVNKISAMAGNAIFGIFDTRPEGLTSREIEQRRQMYGANRLPKASALSLWRLLIQQVTHLMALLLWVAGGAAFAVDMPELGWATWSVIIINGIFSFWQEYRADKALTALAAMLPRKVKVYRDGKLVQLLAEELVIGDVIVLEAGDHIAADARLVEVEDLMVDLSLLTGESLPVERQFAAVTDNGQTASQNSNLVFAGTTATSGRGVGVVYAVGTKTELGKVTQLTAGVSRGKSSLEMQIQRIVRLITVLAISIGVVVFALAVWLLGIDMRSSFIFCIGIIVANVPEGLLPTLSLSLAVGVQRMARQNALVRKLSAVETLCATSVICTDKTGTITMNEVTVRRIWLPDAEIAVSGNGYEKAGRLNYPRTGIEERVGMLLKIGVVCSDASLEPDSAESGTWRFIGDPTEVALLIAAAKGGYDVDAVRGSFSIQKTKQFDSVRKMMSREGLNGNDPAFAANTNVIFVKGAPVETLNCCNFIRKGNGVAEITEDERRQIIAANDRLAGEGHRVLALAYREGALNSELAERDLIFVGLAAMIDPPRPEVAEAVKVCRQAGIGITMITGDYGLTGAAVGRQIGLVDDDEVTIITGDELENMEKQNLADLLTRQQPIIFARANPEHKLKIVEAYKSLGHIVAVTGDGVNDAPALKSADIGIAMGRGGTDVAREVADIVLLDDNFATIIKAIEQGRAIYANIRKFMTYILASNIPELIPFIAMVFFKIPPALSILQILAIDIGTDMVPALALGAEPPEKGVMKRRPADYSQKLLDKSLLLRSYLFLGSIEAALSMAAFLLVWINTGYSLAEIQQVTPQILYNTADSATLVIYQHATTMALTAIIACQIGNLILCRSENLPFWQLPLTANPMIFLGIATELAIAGALVYVPFLMAVFLTQPLTLADLRILIFCPLILIILEELRRFFIRRFWRESY